jgi:hypothetical protein
MTLSSALDSVFEQYGLGASGTGPSGTGADRPAIGSDFFDDVFSVAA